MEDKKIIFLVSVFLSLLLMSSSSIASYFIFFNSEESTSQSGQPTPTTQPTPTSQPTPTTPTTQPTPTSQPTPTQQEQINAIPGQAISCKNYNPKGSGAIYRYDGNKTIRWYPNPTIADSWDKDWSSGAQRIVDCTGFTLNADIQMKS